jgi:hypothetical protein
MQLYPRLERNGRDIWSLWTSLRRPILETSCEGFIENFLPRGSIIGRQIPPNRLITQENMFLGRWNLTRKKCIIHKT